MKKILLLFITVMVFICAKPAFSKSYVGIEAGYNQRILTKINEEKLATALHGYGGAIGVNYGYLWDIGKIFSLGADGFISYMGNYFPHKANSGTFHSFVFAGGLVFHFNVSRKVSIQLRSSLGFIVDSYIGSSNSDFMSGAHWRILPGVIIKPRRRIGIPIEIGYVGSYVNNASGNPYIGPYYVNPNHTTWRSTSSIVMHGFQVLTGVRFYFGT